MARKIDLTTESGTALRAYLYLIGCAAREKAGEKVEETVTAVDLARRLGLESESQLNEPLKLLALWCKQNGLPNLASLVTGPKGLPRSGADVGEQELVWRYDWFVIFPPTTDELGTL